ncbi:Uncharacterized protein Adt_35692 [Abeliophyllum distichum]|uniref:Uncharacterized protein n=1 Tax=Abeliophyllum distichum TaxID=126358 RepID=A0ABD1QJE4_9LAMI
MGCDCLFLKDVFGVSFNAHFMASKKAAKEPSNLACVQKILSDVNNGEIIDSQLLSEFYLFRVAVEGLRIALNNAARLPLSKIRDSNTKGYSALKSYTLKADVSTEKIQYISHSWAGRMPNFKASRLPCLIVWQLRPNMCTGRSPRVN